MLHSTPLDGSGMMAWPAPAACVTDERRATLKLVDVSFNAARFAASVVMRPLRPALTRTLALIEHHSKQDYEALAVVRNAQLTLRHSIGRGGSASATRLAGNRSTAPASAKRPRVT